MDKNFLRIFSMVAAIGCAAAMAAPPTPPKPVTSGSAANPNLGWVQDAQKVSVDGLRPLPDNMPIRRYVVGQGVVQGGSAGDPVGEEVYRNTLGQFVFPTSAPGERLADDIRTICAGSMMTYLGMQVAGPGDGTGPGFSIDFELFDGCPSDPISPGVPIPGTAGHADLPDDGAFLVEFIPDIPVSIPGGFWLGITFETAGSGWVTGSPAEIGLSDDNFDGPFACATFYGGCPPNPCASFYADIYSLSGSCLSVYRAYEASAFSGFFGGLALDEQFADDILPISSPGLCEVAQYDASLAGLDGIYTMTLELFADDEAEMRPGSPVMGTLRNFMGQGNGFLELASFEVLPVAAVPTAKMWLTYDVAGNEAGPILAADFPEVGFSDDCFALFGNPDPGVWSQCVWFYGGCPQEETGNPCATFQAKIFCTGTEPAGACCDIVTPDLDDCRNDIPTTQCFGRFVQDANCGADPFDPPCGTAACCTEDGGCANATEAQCAGLWTAGEFCEQDNFTCPNTACIAATNDCFTENLNAGGCNSATCCSIVCGVDDFCCAVAYDETCVGIAMSFCPLPAPDTCSSATTLTCGQTTVVDNTLGITTVDEPGFSCHNMGANEQGEGAVWAKFVATTTTARLNTCDSDSPADDSLLAVYTGICGNLSEIGCSDDVDGCQATTGFNSEICVGGLSPGQTYYVQLAAWTNADRGRYNIQLECPQPAECGPPPPPSNDLCAAAIPITDGTVSYNNTSAGLDGPALPAMCNEGFGLGFAADIWYNYTAPVTGMATLDLCNGTDYDSRVAVYTGCGCPQTTGATLACNDDNCGVPPVVGGASELSFPITQGQCYKIRVGGFPAPDPVGNGMMAVTSQGTGDNCPSGAVTFVNPANGTVDARQPNPVNSPTPRQGIQTLTVTAPAGADDTCWRMCETAQLGGANSIQNVVEGPAGTYTLSLARPITPNAVTRLSYNPTAGGATTGTFTFHPSNVNGDSTASPIDILKVIDCLNGVSPDVNCPWGVYSRDIDQSGASGPADILKVIDLLNGADVFDPWNGTPLPSGTCTP